MNETQLLEWALAILQREQRAKTYGTIKIQMQEGRIVRAHVETSETPGDPVAIRRYPLDRESEKAYSAK